MTVKTTETQLLRDVQMDTSKNRTKTYERWNQIGSWRPIKKYGSKAQPDSRQNFIYNLHWCFAYIYVYVSV